MINITARKNKHKALQPDKHYCGPKVCLHHPVALFINRESRYETLLHYTSFVRQRTKFGQCIATQLIYYRKGRDQLLVTMKEVIGAVAHGQFDWMAGLKESNGEEWLAGLEKLEIVDWYWDWNSMVRENFLKRQVKLLGELKGLKELHLSVPSWHGFQRVVTETGDTGEGTMTENAVEVMDNFEIEAEVKKLMIEGMEEFFRGVRGPDAELPVVTVGRAQCKCGEIEQHFH